MRTFQFFQTALQGLVEIEPLYVTDKRGFFTKTFESELFASHGINLNPFEEVRSFSQRGTLRGLHFQKRHSQDKLVSVLRGEVYDVAVDIRDNSPTFGRWEGFRLSAENRRMLYLPKGFAHGFFVMSEVAEMHYLLGDRYDPGSETGILWNDSELAIVWPLAEDEAPLLSPRDAAFPTLAEFKKQMPEEIDT